DVHVVALEPPVATVETQSQTGKRPTQRGSVRDHQRSTVPGPRVDLVHRAPVQPVAPAIHVPLWVGAAGPLGCGHSGERQGGTGGSPGAVGITSSERPAMPEASSLNLSSRRAGSGLAALIRSAKREDAGGGHEAGEARSRVGQRTGVPRWAGGGRRPAS